MLTVLLKPSELGLQPADFNKQPLKALSYRERLCGFLLSNDFLLYLPRTPGVEIEVLSLCLCLTHVDFVSTTGELQPAEGTAVQHPPAWLLQPKVVCPRGCSTRCLRERLRITSESHEITAYIFCKLIVDDNISIINYHLL